MALGLSAHSVHIDMCLDEMIQLGYNTTILQNSCLDQPLTNICLWLTLKLFTTDFSI